MKRYIFLFSLLMSIGAWGQNLVLDSLPTAIENIAEMLANKERPDNTALFADEERPFFNIHDSVSTIINRTLDSLAGTVSVVVYDADADTAVFVRDGQLLMHPASTLKLFSCVAALHYLGADYSFRTEVYSEGGNLYVRGGMDPTFSSKQMNSLADQIVKAGIQKIDRLYADLSLKDLTDKGVGWCWDDTGEDSPVLMPLLYNREADFMQVLLERLRSKGIRVANTKSGRAVVPQNARLVAQISRPLMEVMPQCLKESDNLYAESILYQLNPRGQYLPAGEGAVRRVQDFLSEIGVAGHYRIVDGSGLSYYNLVSAQMEATLLCYAYADPRIYRYLRESLPAAGMDGTLKKRLTEPDMQGRVRAKTGSISGAVSLAGYAYAECGRTYVFSIICNGVAPGESKHYRAMQDKILTLLCLQTD